MEKVSMKVVLIERQNNKKVISKRLGEPSL